MSEERRPDDRRALLNSALQKLEQMQSRLKIVEGSQKEPIAIIGMGCRFPGGANTPDQYWELLRNGVDAVREVPADRWKVDDYYDADPDAPGKTYAKFGGFLDQIDKFDPQFFGISPREAMTLDPQQRLVLEVGWEALENAGYGALPKLRGSRTGVFIGAGSSDYAQLQMVGGVNQIDAYTGSGAGLCFAAGRFSYCLGLQGPSFTVDTACSSSLVAVHLACQSLRSSECRMAVAGGVNVIIKPELFVYLSKVKALAPDGRCKVFDAKADGFVRGEGCGIIVLKRLSDAVADGDNILAVIRGSAVNQDGASTGLTVPNGPAQQSVIGEALSRSGVEPADMDYIEAHGTGTSLGDPIEVGAMVAALGRGRGSDRTLTVASVKTNLGHLEAAAGIAGLIKVVLAMGNSEIPAHLHYKTLNPAISFGSVPFVIPTTRQPWPARKRARIAGVSSFGLSGTNAHVVLEEAPAPKIQVNAAERPLHLLALSARTPEALKELCREYADYFEAHPQLPLADVCFTANTGRSHFGQRLAIAEPTLEKVRATLAAFVSNDRSDERSNLITGSVEQTGKPKIAFVFGGAGTQYAGIGRPLYETQPTFRRAVDRVDKLLHGDLENSLIEFLFPAPAVGSKSDRLDSTGRDKDLKNVTFNDAALFAIEYALSELWRSWGIEPSVVLGYGVGEYAAACAAGVLSLEGAVKLVAARGQLIHALSSSGAAQEIPSSSAISLASIERANTLPTFGSPQAMSALRAFSEVARTVESATPKLHWISSVTGELASGVADANYWTRHLREAPLLKSAFSMLKTRAIDFAIEIGPGAEDTNTMAELARECGIDKVNWVSSIRSANRFANDDWKEMFAGLATLFTHGASVDWDGVDRDYARSRVALPTYPFQRQRYWSEPASAISTKALIANAIHPLLGREVRSPLFQDRVFETEISAETHPFLNDHRVFGVVVFPAAAYLVMVLAAVREAFGAGTYALEDIAIREALLLPEKENRIVQVVIGKIPVHAGGDLNTFKVFSHDMSGTGDWALHVSGHVRSNQASADSSSADSPSLEELRIRCTRAMAIQPYYEKLRECGIEFGPSFRGVSELKSGDGESLGRVTTASVLSRELWGFEIHPAVLDGGLQVLGAALPQLDDDVVTTYLPIGIERFILHESAPAQFWSYASLRPASGSSDSLTSDITLFGDNGRVVAEILGFQVKRVSREALLRVRGARPLDWLHEEWEAKSLASDSSIPKNATHLAGVWMIVAFDESSAAAMSESLRARGERVILARLGTSWHRETTDSIILNVNSVEDCRMLFSDGAKDAALSGVVLACTGNRNAMQIDSAVCRGVMHLAQAASDTPATRMFLATCGAQSTTSFQAPELSQSILVGLARSLAIEQPKSGWVRIDLDPEATPESNAFSFANELLSRDDESEIAFRRKLRYVRRAARISGSPLDKKKNKIRADATYLVTGGLGGLGLIVAKWLVEKGARHLVLVGRKGAEGKAAEAVAELESRGVSVRVVRGDIADEKQMKSMFAAIAESMPPLAGIIHSAGVVEDGLIGQLSWESFERVFSPKVRGAALLHQFSEKLTLDFFVLFSSAASFFGSAGQSNYVAANSYLDALARYRHAIGLPAVSINWGAWEGDGMAADVDDVHKRRWSKRGSFAIDAKAGTAALERTLDWNQPQVAVLSVDWTTLRNEGMAPSIRTFASGLLTEVNDVDVARLQSTSDKTGISRTALVRLSEDERDRYISEYLSRSVVRVLGLPQDSIKANDRLAELGLDSLMALELRDQLETDLELTLPMTRLLDNPSVRELARFVMETIGLADTVATSENIARQEVTAPDIEEGEL